MKYCAKCGAQMLDEMPSCPACGWTVPSEPVIEQAPACEQTSFAEHMPIAEEVEPVIQPKKKKTWLWVALSLTLVLLSAAAVWFFLLRGEDSKNDELKHDEPVQQVVAQEEFVLSDAIDESREELKTLFSNKENLQAFIDVLCDRIESNEASLTYAAASELEPGKVDASLQLNYRGGYSVLDGNIDLGIQYKENEADFEIKFALNGNALQLTAPGLIDEVLEVNFSNTLQSEVDLDKAEGVKDALSKVLIDELIDQLLDSIEASEETQETILFGEEERECTLYTITYGEEIADELMQALGIEETTEEDSAQQILQLIVYERQVVGLIERSEQGETVETQKLLLCGTENPWSDVRFYEEEEEVGNIAIEQTENGFEVVITDIEDASEVRFVCDDKAQTFTIESREDDVDVVLSYGVDGDEITLIAETQYQEPIVLKLAPLEKTPEILSDDAINIEQMSEMQASLLVMSALQKLKDDPQTTWIYDLIMNKAAAQ